jgi:hypothetical protein
MRGRPQGGGQDVGRSGDQSQLLYLISRRRPSRRSTAREFRLEVSKLLIKRHEGIPFLAAWRADPPAPEA